MRKGLFPNAQPKRTWQMTLAVILFFSLAAPIRFYGPLTMPHLASFSIVEPVLMVGALWVGVTGCATSRVYVGSPQILVLLSLPAISSLFSIAWSVDPSLTMKSIGVQCEALVAYLVAVNILRGLDVKAHFRILIGFVVFMLAVSLASYVPVPGLWPQVPPNLPAAERAAFLLSYHARLSHPFIGLSNNFASILLLVAPVLMAIAWQRMSGLWWLLSGLSLAGLVATMSRGAMAGLFIASVSGAFWWVVTRLRVSTRWLRIGALLVGFSAAGGGLFMLASPPALHHITDRLSGANVEARFDIYHQAWTSIKQSPLVGVGAGVGLNQIERSARVRSVHNAYLQALFWYGVPLGIVVALVLVMLPVVVSRIPAFGKCAPTLRSGLIIALIAQAACDMFETSWEGSMLRLISYAFIGLSLSLLRALNEEARYMAAAKW